MEDIIYKTITDNLIKYNINYYHDELIIQALQILSSNYITYYSLLAIKGSDTYE